MPQSLSSLIVHVVFSTKDREQNLTDNVLASTHAYLSAVARSEGCHCFRVGGVADHVHLAVDLPRTTTVAKLIESLKTSSSKWLKEQAPELVDFSWQRGYGAFSIARSDIDALVRYIDGQAEHHRKRTFKDEFMAILKEHNVDFDPRYVWE